MKPGIKTSEFWLVIANTVLMVLVAFGIFEQADVDKLNALLAPFIGALVPLVVYIIGRAQIKMKQ